MCCRHYTFPQASDGMAPPAPWNISESYQKPPLPSPKRPPAPPSLYNRSSQATQPSNPFRGKPTLRHSNSTSQPGRHRTASGCLTGTVGELDCMGIAGEPMHNGNFDADCQSAQRMNRSNSGWSNESRINRSENAKPYRPLVESKSVSMPGQMMGSQVDGALPDDDCQQVEPRPSVARSSRSHRTRPGGSRAGSRASSAIGSAASAWVQSHSAHQLAANVKALAAEVIYDVAMMTCTHHFPL